MIDISRTELALISCRNSSAMINYVSDRFGQQAITELFFDILSPITGESEKYQYLGKPLTVDFFKDENNWYSNEINLKIFDNLSNMGVDAFNTGRFAVSAAKMNKNFATIAYLQMLGPEKIIRKINKVNSIYNRTKRVEVINFERNSGTIKLVYSYPHSPQVTRQNLGAYVGILEAAGLKGIECNVEVDDFSDKNFTIIHFSWQTLSLLKKWQWLFGKLIALSFCKTYLASNDVIETFHKNVVASFENEIAEKERQRKKSENYYNALTEQQEKKEHELKLLVDKKTAQLTQSIKDKEKLFENFSHELKTPLTLIIGPIEKILKQPLSISLHQELSLINKNAHRLYDLVNTLLSYAEIKLTKNKYTEINIYDTTLFILDSLSAMAEEKCAKIYLDFKIQQTKNIKLQIQTWELILTNLLTNAIKHGNHHNYITVTITQNNDIIRLKVNDKNSPLPVNIHSQFDLRFKSTQDNMSGHGLGLAIIHELVDNHSGQFTVNTTAQGNEFIINLPIKVESRDSFDANSYVKSPRTTKLTAKILIVEDNLELAEFLISSFKDKFTVIHAEHGKQAIEFIDANHIDLIVSDVMMPIMNGYELCKLVKSSDAFQHIPLILLTAKSDLNSQKTGFALHADDYIGKPFNTDVLVQKVTNIISTYQAHAKRIKYHIISGVKTEQQTPLNKYSTNKEAEFLTKLETFLHENFQNHTLKTTDIANSLHVSEKTLNRKLQALLGSSFTELLREYRLNQAKLLLLKGDKIKNVCFDCGFSSVSYFTSCFNKQFNLTPAAFQKSHLNTD